MNKSKNKLINKLPKILYAKIEKDGEGEFIISSIDPSGISESESSICAGVYELKRIVKIVNKTEVIVREKYGT